MPSTSNIIQQSVPSFYSSANDDVVYTFEFKELLMNGIGDNGGNAQIVLFSVFDITPVIGEKIHVTSNLYNGTYTILSVDSTAIVTIDTPYIGVITVDTYYCYHLRVPVFQLYKGFKSGEIYDTELPYTLVTSIKPSVLYNSTTNIPYLSINVKGITKYLFTIVSNTIANSVDFSMFNVLRMVWDNTSTIFSSTYDYTIVLNCAISNEDLNYKYVGLGFSLLPIDKPLIASSGVTFVSVIASTGQTESCFPVVYKFVNGVLQ